MQELSRSIIIVHRIVFVFFSCLFSVCFPPFFKRIANILFLCPQRITWVSWVLLFCWNWKSLMEKTSDELELISKIGISSNFMFHIHMKVVQQYDHTCVARWSIFRLNNSLPKSIIYTSSILIWLATTCARRTKIHQIWLSK